MNTLLAVDPGLRGVGLAYFLGPKLVYANYLRNTVESGGGAEAWFAMADVTYFDMKERGYRVDHYVVEMMQVYRNSPGDPNDLLELVAVGAAIGASFPLKRATSYRPREYKGQLKKEKFAEITLAQLAEDELAAIVEKRKTYAHNVYDAIGLGLYQLERDSVRFSK